MRAGRAMSETRSPREAALGAIRDDGRWISGTTIGLLDDLLMHTIAMRDLYKSARCQTDEVHFRHLRLLFDAHYKEQFQLVDVLVDRIRALGGTDRISASVFLQGKPASCTLRSRLGPARAVERSARGSRIGAQHRSARRGLNGQEAGQSSGHDRAVEQVALLNDRQACVSDSSDWTVSDMANFRASRRARERAQRQRHGASQPPIAARRLGVPGHRRSTPRWPRCGHLRDDPEARWALRRRRTGFVMW